MAKKILAVEDDLLISEIYKDIVTKEGFEFERAEDAMSAVTIFQSFKPDLIILDVELPAGGGQKVYDTIRRVFQSAVPVIFSTGHPEKVEKFKSYVNTSIMSKPTNPEALLAEIKKLLKME